MWSTARSIAVGPTICNTIILEEGKGVFMNDWGFLAQARRRCMQKAPPDCGCFEALLVLI